MRLTLSSARAQRILEVINDSLTRGTKAPTYSVQIGFHMAGAKLDATPGEVGFLLVGLAEYLRDKLPPEFAITLDVQLYANHKATEKVVSAVQTELQAMDQEMRQALKKGTNEASKREE